MIDKMVKINKIQMHSEALKFLIIEKRNFHTLRTWLQKTADTDLVVNARALKFCKHAAQCMADF
jgi:hypothetical protein